MTKKLQKALENHRKMWGWLADNPDKFKEDWPEWKANGGRFVYRDNDCFLCDMYLDPDSDPPCPKCVDWGVEMGKNVFEDDVPCEMDGSPFSNWRHTHSTEHRARFAAVIRDLPLK